MTPPIYLDNHATTKIDDSVLDAMLPYLKESFGNPSSTHFFGHKARMAVEDARRKAASLINASPREIVFTSGATEAINLALKGCCDKDKGHIITQVTEHKAVLKSCKRLEECGHEVTYLPVDKFGNIDIQELRNAIREDTRLVSIMHINNEVGTIFDIDAIGAIVKESNAYFHCDATQSVGLLDVDVERAHLDMLSCSAHKIYGPKGSGFLWQRRRGKKPAPNPQLHGGSQEYGQRAGTLNVAGIVGLGKSAELAKALRLEDASRLRAMRDGLFARLAKIEGFHLHGPALENRHPGNLNISFEYVDADDLMLHVHSKLAISSGSACSSSNAGPSYVLRAIGVENRLAASSLRIGMGRHTTQEEVDACATILEEAITELRELSPLWRNRDKINEINW